MNAIKKYNPRSRKPEKVMLPLLGLQVYRLSQAAQAVAALDYPGCGYDALLMAVCADLANKLEKRLAGYSKPKYNITFTAAEANAVILITAHHFEHDITLDTIKNKLHQIYC